MNRVGLGHCRDCGGPVSRQYCSQCAKCRYVSASWNCADCGERTSRRQSRRCRACFCRPPTDLPKGVLVDLDVREFYATQFRWYIHRTTGYVCGYPLGDSENGVFLHRRIMEAGERELVDHINGNRLDNRRDNLRLVDASGNSQNLRGLTSRNKSGHRGVHWSPKDKRWIAQGQVGGVRYRVGYFTNCDIAGKAIAEWRAANMPMSQEARA